MGKTKRGKGTKIMAISDGNGLPIGVHVDSASPHEVALVDTTMEAVVLNEVLPRLIGDKAYDSDQADANIKKKYGTDLIAPNRSNRKRKTQDGRQLRRYKRRYQVERLFAWLHNYRRIVVRWERHMENFRALVMLACSKIVLNRF